MHIIRPTIRKETKYLVGVVVVCCCLLVFPVYADKLAIANTTNGPVGSYVFELLELVLSHVDEKHSVDRLKGQYPPARLVLEMNNKNIDVHWSSVRPYIQGNAIPIKIDILKGLLGKRVLLIKRKY